MMMKTEPAPESVYTEQCSCGALVSFSGDRITRSMWAHVKAWRVSHQHSERPANRVSTTAKGEFGYLGYANSLFGDDEEDDDD